MHDELSVLSNVYSYISCSFGRFDAAFTKYIPDFSLTINDKKYAITVLTNVNISSDSAKASSIQKQRMYYEELLYEPLFFIERANLAFDIDGESLVLWETELQALTTQTADMLWQEFLEILHLLTLTKSIQSILYITPSNKKIAIQPFHIMPHLNTKPLKAHFFNQPYTLEISEAFKIKDKHLTLANILLELEAQQQYKQQFSQRLSKHIAEQEQRRLAEEEFEKQRVADEALIKQQQMANKENLKIRNNQKKFFRE